MNLIAMSNKPYAQDFRKYMLRAAVKADGRAVHVCWGDRVILFDENGKREFSFDAINRETGRSNINIVYEKMVDLIGNGPSLILTCLAGGEFEVAFAARRYIPDAWLIHDIFDNFQYGQRGLKWLKLKVHDRKWRHFCDFGVVLEGTLREFYPDYYFLYNASHLQPLPKVKTIDPAKLVYAGSIDKRVDFEWIEALASQNVTLDIYGCIDSDLSRPFENFLARYSNARYRGKYKNDELADILQPYRTGITPYKNCNPITHYVNPDQFYHYLNAGLEVLAPPFPQALRLAKFIHVTDLPSADWLNIRQIISDMPRNSKWPRKRCSWDLRWQELQDFAAAYARNHPASVKNRVSPPASKPLSTGAWANIRIASRNGKAYLQLGCGGNLLEGWCNTDIKPVEGAHYLDFSKTFPITADTIDAIFCEHTIEHIDKKTAYAMCAEVFHVLKKGGAFRIVTPSLENMAALVQSPASSTARHYLQWWRHRNNDPWATIADTVNSMFYDHGHRHIYTRDELCGMLKNIGFVNLKLLKAGEHAHAAFKGIDSHGKVIGEDINRIEAFALEAEKPSNV